MMDLPINLLHAQDGFDFDKSNKNIKLGFLAKKIINFRLNDRVLILIFVIVAIIAIIMNSLPLLNTSWIHVVEPKPIKREDSKGDIINLLYEFDAGYFHVCRKYIFNENITEYFYENETFYFETECHWSSSFHSDELSEYSTATIAILQRTFIPSTMHIIGCFLNIAALILGIYGYFDKSLKTLTSAIFLTVGSLSVAAAVLQVVCIVDDEMSSRIKPNAAGELPLYSFKYNWGFFTSALSFLPFQACIYCQVVLYMRRFKNLNDIQKIVPGLLRMVSEKIPNRKISVSPVTRENSELSNNNFQKKFNNMNYYCNFETNESNTFNVFTNV
uniref:Uncharacterized protein n=1 Tax=Strongyloides venezuelensis TaxID=75913 RepID=A0A0K0F8Z1_STRVS